MSLRRKEWLTVAVTTASMAIAEEMSREKSGDCMEHNAWCKLFGRRRSASSLRMMRGSRAESCGICCLTVVYGLRKEQA